MRSALQFRNIAERFSGKAALRDIGFSFEKGGGAGLVGTNGAGKTALIDVFSISSPMPVR